MEPTLDYVLLDTNIVSYMFKGHALADAYAPHLEGKRLAISFMTVAELYYWMDKNDWGPRRRGALETALRTFTVVPYDFRVAQLWGAVTAQRDRIGGRVISCADAWVAASALRHGIPVVTHNAKDFYDVEGLKLITEYRRIAED